MPLIFHQVRHKLDRLKEENLQLNQQIAMYGAAGSTPGSTPSSSVVNINDVGQLPVELHVPHINEPDAISARATVSYVLPHFQVFVSGHLINQDTILSCPDPSRTPVIKDTPF